MNGVYILHLLSTFFVVNPNTSVNLMDTFLVFQEDWIIYEVFIVGKNNRSIHGIIY